MIMTRTTVILLTSVFMTQTTPDPFLNIHNFKRLKHIFVLWGFYLEKLVTGSSYLLVI